LAGGARTAVYLAAAARRSGEGIRDAGDDSKRGASIPRARRKRAALGTFSASQRGSGWLLAAAEDDGHGGVLGYWELFHGREREERARERR
jgi:hypothetical protein